VAGVSCKPATIEVTALPPDSKVAAVLRFDRAPNQFIQYNQLLRSLSMENTCNARISVKVTGGGGKVTAYASVIDSQTQDPTYIPAQQNRGRRACRACLALEWRNAGHCLS